MAFIKGPGSWGGIDEEDQGSGVIGGGTAVGGQNAGRPMNSSWTNLQQYLKANENAGGKIAGAITKSTQDDVDAVGQSRVEFEQKAKGQVDANTRKDDYSSQILSDPTKIDDNQFGAWKGLSNYWGKGDATGTDGYADIKGKVDSTQNNINTANDYYGQNVLANKAFGKGPNQYSQGMGYLDTFVARADQTGKDAFQGFQDRNAGFGDQWKGTTKNVNDYIGGAGSRGQSAYDGVMGSVGSKIGSINTDAQGRADAYTDKTEAYQDLQSKVPTSWQIGANTLDRYVSRNNKYGAEDVYNDADLAALNKLARMDDDETTGVYQRGTDKAYNTNTEGYRDWVRSINDQIGSASPVPTNPVTGVNSGGINPITLSTSPNLGPTPLPQPGAPLPSPVGPRPSAPIPTSPQPLPPSSIGSVALPTSGAVGTSDPTTRTNSTINYDGPRPADWPLWMPWPVPLSMRPN